MEAYARVSCIILESDAVDCTEPFTVTRSSLVELLAVTFPVEEAHSLLAYLENDHPIQVPISTSQARQLGFVLKVN